MLIAIQGRTTKLATPYLHPTIHLNGADLFKLTEDRKRPGAYSEATVTIKYMPTHRAGAAWGPAHGSGPGIYGCFWRGELFYIGTYAGKDADLKAGNVAEERWCKHIEGMTFRSRRIGIAPSRLLWILQRHSSNSLLATLLGRGNREILTKKGGNGNQVQYNKFLFANQHWRDFSILDQSMMKLFDFVYLRPNLDNVFLKMGKEQIDSHLRAVEGRAIRQLCPPCNGASKQNTTGKASSIVETERAAEKLMIAQVEGFLSGDAQYQCKPRKRRQVKKKW